MVRHAFVVLCVVVAACGGRIPEAPLPEVEGGLELGLARYSSWSFVRVKPPHLIGPDHSLRLERGHLRGNLGGRLADLRITNDRVTGWVAGRPVELAIEHAQGELLAEGLWSGQTSRLTATDSAIHASVPLLRDGAVHCCLEWNLERLPNDGQKIGFNVYVAARPYPPEAARLEIPEQLLGWYSSAELAVVLMALMGS